MTVILGTSVLCALLYGLSHLCIGIRPPPAPPFYKYWPQDFQNVLRSVGLESNGVFDVRRNEQGTELFLTTYNPALKEYQLVSLGPLATNIIKVPSANVSLGPDRSLLAWSDQNGENALFRSGESIPLPKFSQFHVDSAGRYFAIVEKPSTTWVGSTGFPSKRKTIANNFLATTLFVREKRVYVCGTCYDETSPNRRHGGDLRCLVLQEGDDGLVVVESYDMPWGSWVADLHPQSNVFLVAGKGDLNRALYVYDITTRKRTRVGQAKAFNLFLVRDPLNASKRNLP